MNIAADSPVLLWFRNDLRLADHAALNAAAATGRPVVPVFVLDEAWGGTWTAGAGARWWLHHSLAALAARLRSQGAALVLRRGRADEVIGGLAEERGAAEVFAGFAIEPWARAVEERLAKRLSALGVGFRRLRTRTLFDPDSLRTRTGGPFGVYSPFCRTAFAAGGPALPVATARFRAAEAVPASDGLDEWRLLPTGDDWSGELAAAWTPGELGARARLEGFVASRLSYYTKGRKY